MRLLFLSRWFPYPADNGSRIRIFNVIRQLARRHEVTLVSFCEEPLAPDAPVRLAMKELCSRVHAVPYRPFRSSSLRSQLGLLSRQPRFLVDTYSQELAATLARECERYRPDVVVASQLDMIPYALSLPDVPTVLEELELSVYRDAVIGERSYPRRLRSLLTWAKLAAYLRRILPRIAACTVASEREKAHLQAIVPAYRQVVVIPNAVDLDDYRGWYGQALPNTLVFAGALTYRANYDAMRYFLDRVYPRIKEAVPEVILRITGRTDGVDRSSLTVDSSVEFTGYLTDVRPLVARSWLSVVPLRIGGGTRLKILEAMALGTPVVSTSKGAEGLEVTDGKDILIADEIETFARRVVAVLRSPELRDELARHARDLLATRYTWQAIGEELDGLVEQVGRRPPVEPLVDVG